MMLYSFNAIFCQVQVDVFFTVWRHYSFSYSILIPPLSGLNKIRMQIEKSYYWGESFELVANVIFKTKNR